MKTVVHLKLARVVSYKNDGSPNIDRAVVKLEAGSSFNKFIDHLRLGRYLKSEPPEVVKVLIREKKKDGKFSDWKQGDVKPFAEALAEALEVTKGTHNKGNETSDSLKAENAELRERLEKLEALMAGGSPGGQGGQGSPGGQGLTDEQIREKVISKANELNIEFNPAIGTAKLLERVREQDADFDPETIEESLA